VLLGASGCPPLGRTQATADRLLLSLSKPEQARILPRADRRKMQKFKFAKFEIAKLQNRKNQNLENFHRNFLHEIDREIVCCKIVFLFPRSPA
jgi:hypothetical protein